MRVLRFKFYANIALLSSSLSLESYRIHINCQRFLRAGLLSESCFLSGNGYFYFPANINMLLRARYNNRRRNNRLHVNYFRANVFLPRAASVMESRDGRPLFSNIKNFSIKLFIMRNSSYLTDRVWNSNDTNERTKRCEKTSQWFFIVS